MSITPSPSITLSPDRGINAKLTTCPRCGGDSPELILLGNSDWKRRCTDCGTMNITNSTARKCNNPDCHGTSQLAGVAGERLGEQEKIPGSPCDSCTEEIESWKKIVEEGGVYFRCSECKVEGVIKAEAEIAKGIRKKTPAPKPMGIEIPCHTCQEKSS